MMKQRLRNRINLKTGLGVTGAVLGAALTGATLTGASAQRTDNSSRLRAAEFPFVTPTRSQSVHLNAVNWVAPPEPVRNTRNPEESELSCPVQFRLFDSDGRIVATETSTIAPGKTGQLVFQAPPEPTMPGSIQGVRAEIAVPRGPCKDTVVGSLEIVDTASGEVRTVVSPALRGLTAPPEPTGQN